MQSDSYHKEKISTPNIKNMHLVIRLITNQDDLHITQNNLGRENKTRETFNSQC